MNTAAQRAPLPAATLALRHPELLCDAAYVDGAWIAADNGLSHPVVNPAPVRRPILLLTFPGLRLDND